MPRNDEQLEESLDSVSGIVRFGPSTTSGTVSTMDMVPYIGSIRLVGSIPYEWKGKNATVYGEWIERDKRFRVSTIEYTKNEKVPYTADTEIPPPSPVQETVAVTPNVPAISAPVTQEIVQSQTSSFSIAGLPWWAIILIVGMGLYIFNSNKKKTNYYENDEEEED